MITICPQCKTGFQITTEQLSVRQGLVRCGRCTTVFNGFAALQNSAETPGQLSDAATTPTSPTDTHIVAPAAPIEPMQSKGAIAFDNPAFNKAVDSKAKSGEPNPAPEEPTHGQAEFTATAIAAASKPAESPSSRTDDVTWPAIESPREFPAVYTKAEQAIEASQSEFTDQSSTSAEQLEEIDWPPIILDDELSASSFETAKAPIDRAAEDEWKPKSKKVREAAEPTPAEEELLQYEPELLLPLPEPAAKRTGWGTFAVVLAILLVLQGAFLLRNDIVATWPEAYPSVRGICLRLGCAVALPRQIDRITIESSELRADPNIPNVIVLTALLRNRTGLMLEYPWLEVSLTDTLDRAVARRSLAPNEYLPRPSSPEEGMPAGSELPVKAAFDSAGTKASGYKLRLYYP
jgi:predicted Zn finger-like uncharacterized protein